MLNKLKPTIALIDSGIGGLSVLKALITRYKTGNYIFYADNQNMPYGNKTKEFVLNRIKSIINELNTNYMPDVIIIACNTASTCINKDEFKNIRTIKVEGRLPTLATPLTKQNTSGNIIADKTLAEMVEQYILEPSKMKEIVKKHVNKLQLNKFKTLILGCTHYELISPYFKELCKDTEIINNSQGLVNEINFQPNNTRTNILLLQAKKDQNYYNKMWQILLN